MFNFFSAFITLLVSIYTISFSANDGAVHSFNEYAGKKILLVNIATGSPRIEQLAQLQLLYQQFHDSLEIVAFPSDSFGNEPLTDSSIKILCESDYHTTFKLATKQAVIGGNKGAIYEWLADIQQNGAMSGTVLGDFQKYLIDRDGALIGVFNPEVSPLNPLIISAVTSN